MEDSKLKEIFSDCIPLFIALGDTTRLTIIEHLFEIKQTGGGQKFPGLNVKEITEQTSLSRPAISHHLKVLRESGLVSVTQRGVCNYYYLTSDSAIDRLIRLKDELQKCSAT